MNILDITAGDRVRYTGNGSDRFGRRQGQTAVVKRVSLKRGIVTIEFDGGSDWFDARPHALDPIDQTIEAWPGYGLHGEGSGPYRKDRG